MARIRTIKPELARHEGLFALERSSGFPIRLVWALLPTICDREGRFKWRPRALKCDILPYDELDFAHVLDVLLEAGFLVKYRVGDDWYGVVPTFTKHQFVNAREQDSSLPAPDAADETVTRAARVAHASVDRNSPARGEGKGREQEGNKKGTGTPRSSLSSASRDPFTDPEVTHRAGRFVERYQELYPAHRHGARYATKPARDYAAAVTLCTTWEDDARLDKLAICFLTTDHKFAAEGSRTIPQFLALASWCDGELAEWEKQQASA